MNSNLLFQDAIWVFLLSLPLVVGGVLHMVAVKVDILSYFKKPIHQRMFGQNKTWRGFIIMPLATWPGVILAQTLEPLFDLNAPVLNSVSSYVLAFSLGFAYCLAELPNSFMKRRLGIKEGKTSEKYKWFFVIFDQADSAVGCVIVYKLLLQIGNPVLLMTVVFGTFIHLFINVCLYTAGIRKNAF